MIKYGRAWSNLSQGPSSLTRFDQKVSKKEQIAIVIIISRCENGAMIILQVRIKTFLKTIESIHGGFNFEGKW